MDSPTVSIIIPTYNRASFLRKAIQSVLQQTYRNFEIIVVDDGSTDDTLESIGEMHNRVTYLYQAHKGRSAARNYGIQVSKGEYIAFLDSDDQYLPQKLELQIKFLENNPSLGMVYSWSLAIDEEGKELPFLFKGNLSGWIYPQLLFSWPITTPTVVVRSDVIEQIGGFSEELDLWEDDDLWRRIARSYPIGCQRQPLCKIRIHPSKILNNPKNLQLAIEKYLNRVVTGDPNLNPKIIRRLYAHYYGFFGWKIFKLFLNYYHPFDFCKQHARQYLVRSIRYWPFQTRVYINLAMTFLHPLFFTKARGLWLSLSGKSSLD
jgi:glycosyltransferase involved in cell wall biosynthesis